MVFAVALGGMFGLASMLEARHWKRVKWLDAPAPAPAPDPAEATARPMILRMAAGKSYLPIHAAPSPAVLAFAFAAAVLTGVLFGVAPAWIAASAASHCLRPIRPAQTDTRTPTISR